MRDIPVFGTRVAGAAYKHRPSAYAVVRNERGEVAVARTPVAYYLPGGGMDSGESAQQTIEREGREECGFILRATASIGKALEICYSAEEREYFEKDSAFMLAEIAGYGTKTEADHELLWLAPDAAIKVLTHGSHRWAVERSSDIS